MKTKLLTICFLLISMFAGAQQKITVYQDCSMNGVTIDYMQSASGSASVLSTSGRTSCEWVQLWEGGPKWATFNVGATITDYANLTVGVEATSYYNYVDQAPYYNTANVGGLYAWNQPNYNGRQTTWTSSVTTGVADVATTLWGDNWKTPTRQQLDTLLNENNSYGKTTWTWCDGSTTQYVAGCTLKGFKVSGVGDYACKSIFLPIAGHFDYRYGTVSGASYFGDYWSSTVYYSSGAYDLYLKSSVRNINNYGGMYGQSVRAVLAELDIPEPTIPEPFIPEPATPANVEVVDMGLSVKWANMNVGATTQEDHGDYFAWGELTVKSDYSWSTYLLCKGLSNNMTKYCTSSDYGTVDNKTTLEPSDDAAHMNWGGEWRMPTDDEWAELYTQCIWEWTTQNGVVGHLVTASNGNSIFLPAAGYRLDADLYNAGSRGYYWSASLYTDISMRAYRVRTDAPALEGFASRSSGLSVRPVHP